MEEEATGEASNIWGMLKNQPAYQILRHPAKFDDGQETNLCGIFPVSIAIAIIERPRIYLAFVRADDGEVFIVRAG